VTDATAACSTRDGRANRRSFTSEEKLAIVLECEQPGNSVSAVAGAHRLAKSALFRWRAEFGYGRKMNAELAPVVLSNEQSTGKTKPAACRSAATAGFTAHGHNVYTLAARDHEAAKIRAQNAKILAETERDERWRQRRGRLLKLAADKRNQSVQAFWAMHVQTPNWNRMAFTHYVPADAGH